LDYRELYVPADDAIYVAPYMLTHYIDTHAYRPPEVFLSAVERCPAVGSAAYFAALEARCPGFVEELRSTICSGTIERAHARARE
jgi:hypothetical protein